MSIVKIVIESKFFSADIPYYLVRIGGGDILVGVYIRLRSYGIFHKKQCSPTAVGLLYAISTEY